MPRNLATVPTIEQEADAALDRLLEAYNMTPLSRPVYSVEQQAYLHF